MIKLDLITGFLGAGKTTFIKSYAKYLMERGERICIIENDFGAINVDMVLLKELESDKCNLEMIVGGDGVEAHKRRLKTKLISMAMLGFERVIIEPSGAYDVDEFFDLVHEEPLDRWYEIGNVIALVSSKVSEELSEYSQYILMSEIANAGAVVLSKVDEASPEEIKSTIEYIKNLLDRFGCKNGLENKLLIDKDIRQDLSALFEIVKCGYNINSYKKLVSSTDVQYQTIFYFGYHNTKDGITSLTKQIFKDQACGNIHRIKGIVRDDASKTEEYYELNATSGDIRISDVSADRSVLIIIGENLSKEEISKYLGNPTL